MYDNKRYCLVHIFPQITLVVSDFRYLRYSSSYGGFKFQLISAGDESLQLELFPRGNLETRLQ